MKRILHGRLIFGLLFLFLALGSFADGRYIPVYEDGIRVDYKYYCLGFNKEHKQANWVYYELGAAVMQPAPCRRPDFAPEFVRSTQNRPAVCRKSPHYAKTQKNFKKAVDFAA